MEKITEIVSRARQTGNTTRLLKAAIKQPDCVIVSKNMQQAKHLEKNYFQLLSKSAWYQKLYWKWFGRKHPKFMTIDSRREETNKDVYANDMCCGCGGSDGSYSDEYVKWLESEVKK